MKRIGRKLRHAAKVECVGQLRWTQNQIAWKILLVVLNDERHGARFDRVLREVRVKILKALDVLLELARLAIGDEHDAVGALEHEPASRLVVDLSRHRVELEARRESRDRAEIEWQEVEKQRAVSLRGEGHHLPFPLIRYLTVDVVQVRRLPGPTRSVVDDLAGDLAGG